MAPLKIKNHHSEIEMAHHQDQTKTKNFENTTDKPVATSRMSKTTAKNNNLKNKMCQILLKPKNKRIKR